MPRACKWHIKCRLAEEKYVSIPAYGWGTAPQQVVPGRATYKLAAAFGNQPEVAFLYIVALINENAVQKWECPSYLERRKARYAYTGKGGEN